jgi:hypothetical protein
MKWGSITALIRLNVSWDENALIALLRGDKNRVRNFGPKVAAQTNDD